ncbi:hypothetical protein [Phenylobacterium sp. J367]|uniref:hypothetical protein n=1 Tax=Phenylobacterium sp. J367 TaxID=2898435 RepID=UPI002151B3F4|nr:hypothetical protein [Phenylobacterium sp. J367]MCR5880055.1 hypothetical protein [Phenylobacterium sp. J367]
MDIIGFQPHALLVADSELADPEVAPDVAGKALDPEPAEAADLEAVRARLDEQPGLGEQDAIPRAGEDRPDSHDQSDGEHHQGLGEDLALQHLGRRGRVGGLAQKLCPMLT